MDIAPVSQTLPQPVHAEQAVDNPQHVADFTRLMTDNARPTPENTFVNRFQQEAIQWKEKLQATQQASSINLAPENMLATQATLLKSISTVDLLAKATGSLSQGINKLTNIQ
ncbi:EscI/YscI/HrpB family type III secretion system inner rod protein [Enterobacterales bacterium CwR94]|nr:EscI/YscI/HrpB family type III secretion system inner rod protein [Enterobacterales bacterium CwR94]